MIVTFCGHSRMKKSEKLKQQILSVLQEKIGNCSAKMYLGGYGDFDQLAYDCCKEYKLEHPNISLVFVSPYLTLAYQKNRLQHEKTSYDEILYFGMEEKPLRYAIYYRNRYMVEKADVVIAFVLHSWGGAYATYQYAKKKGKEIFNLADFEAE